MSTEPRTLSELTQALREGTLTVHGLMQRVLDERSSFAPQAWITEHAAPQLLARADDCDAQLQARGAAALDAQPLLGIPFALKDNIDVAGWPTTAACPSYAPAPAARHASVVQRLVNAGAIPVGKTNLDQFATGLVGTRSPFGAVPNPFDPARVSGGSSSGSAYVVSTGQVPFALGTDTAGSGRVPAGFCNIAGLKPTRGWLSTHGVVPACRSLDCVSVFALSPEDAWTVASLAAGLDPLDPFSRSAVPPRLRVDRLEDLRIGVPDPLEFFGDTVAAQAFDSALAALRGLGCRVVPVPFAPLERAASLLYQGPWVAERYAAVGEFLARRPADADPTVSAIVLGGADASAHDLFHAQHEMEALRAQAARQWNDIDVLFVPTAPTHPAIADLRADPFEPNRRLGHYTNFVNLLDMAAHALPGPFRSDGLPAGVTLIGPAFSDFALAQLATRLARSLQPTAGAMRHALGVAPSLAAAVPARPVRLVAVGAHMGGLALNWQFQERGARLVARTTTAPHYRMYSLTGTTPTRPGLVHVGPADGRAIEVEVWEMDSAHVGSFLALVGAPLALGTVELADGSSERGFVCEPRGVAAGSPALDITHHGGWRGFLASLAS
ncbi:allophanate hydrolase [Piscinibacter sp.]|uniref:allophanate hydrolase n=1 Tax=Piscinibacter sp. TaxID=1903157 RepID=UPI002C46A348|nr:allophanate hydrolase [Albitalea sp.]HUG22628.1 allophanate hydrolase [Albitalea sp.]